MRRKLLLAISLALAAAIVGVWVALPDTDSRSDSRRVIGATGALAVASAPKQIDPLERMGYEPTSIREKAIFPGRNLRPHRVMIATRARGGMSCVVHVQDDRLDESCADDLFKNAPVHVLESFTASSSGERLTYQLVGVVDASVAAVEVVDTRGVARPTRLTDGGLYFELSSSDLAKGTKAARVLAYGPDARLLATIDLEPS